MISVVVPVYNVENYLDECVRSVLGLEVDFELILVDDGSTDTSGDLCDKWAEYEKRIHVIHQENGGLSSARNTGIRNAKGEYVLFLDSDDFLNTEEANQMLEHLIEKPDVLVGLYRNYYPENLVESQFEDEHCGDVASRIGKTSIIDFLSTVPTDGKSFFMTAWRFVCRREILLNCDLFFLPGIYHEDEEWTQRLFCCISTVFVSCNFFYNYRQGRKDSITARVSSKHDLDLLTIMERASKLIRNENLEAERVKYIRRRMAGLYIDFVAHSYLLENNQRTEIAERIRPIQKICRSELSGCKEISIGILVRFLGVKFVGMLFSARSKMKR